MRPSTAVARRFRSRVQPIDDFRYVIVLSPASLAHPESTNEAVTRAHIAHVERLEVNGQLELAGPFSDGGDMLIIRGTSEAQARAIAEADPLVSTGSKTYELKKWALGNRRHHTKSGPVRTGPSGPDRSQWPGARNEGEHTRKNSATPSRAPIVAAHRVPRRRESVRSPNRARRRVATGGRPPRRASTRPESLDDSPLHTT